MATDFSVKIGEIGLFNFFRRHRMRKRIAVSHFWFMYDDDLATSYKHFGELRSSNFRVLEGEMCIPPHRSAV